MLRKLATAALVLLLLVAGGTLWAEPESPQKPGPYSLQDCIQIAMQNQVDIIVAGNNVIAAKSRSDQAKSAYFPQLSIQNNAFTWGSDGVLSRTTTGTALNVTQNIWDGGLREANAKSARYGVTQSSARLARTQQSVQYLVTQSYYEALRAKHLAEVAEADVEYSQALKEQVQARVEEGDAAEVDVLPVEAQLANARVGLLNARNEVRTALLRLQNTMGLSPQENFDIQDVTSPPQFEAASLDQYMMQAQANRPDVIESKAGVGAAQAQVSAARLRLYPRPVISAQYQREISGGFTTSGGQVVGGFVFDIFNGGANRAAYREAQAQKANAQQQEAQVYKDIQVEVEEAYLNLESARERLAASAAGREAAEKNYEVQRDRYNQGLAIPLDLLNAELQLVTARTNEVQARYDYYTSIAQLEYAIGEQGEQYAN